MARFLALGRLAVDFVHTGGEGWRARWETWDEPADLADWFAWSSLRTVDVVVSRADLGAAKSLREDLWGVFETAVGSQPLPEGSVASMNAAAARPPLVPQLVGSRESEWKAATVTAALSTISRDAIELLAARDRRLRQCANPRCFIMFYDDSRPGTRRWCQPNRCGDRLRAQAYRARHTANAQPKENPDGHPVQGRVRRR